MPMSEDPRRTIETATALARTYMARAEQLLARADYLMLIARKAQHRLEGAEAQEAAEIRQVRQIVEGG